MMKGTSVLRELKERFGNSLRSNLLSASVVQSAEELYFEYTIQDTDECTVIYRHDLDKWDKPLTRKEMMQMGYNHNELKEMTRTAQTVDATDYFLGNYVHGDIRILVMLTNIFTEDGAERLLAGG